MNNMVMYLVAVYSKISAASTKRSRLIQKVKSKVVMVPSCKISEERWTKWYFLALQDT